MTCSFLFRERGAAVGGGLAGRVRHGSVRKHLRRERLRPHGVSGENFTNQLLIVHAAAPFSVATKVPYVLRCLNYPVTHEKLRGIPVTQPDCQFIELYCPPTLTSSNLLSNCQPQQCSGVVKHDSINQKMTHCFL